jgi:hypothetical protein
VWLLFEKVSVLHWKMKRLMLMPTLLLSFHLDANRDDCGALWSLKYFQLPIWLFWALWWVHVVQ